MDENEVFDFDAKIEDEDGSIYPVPGVETIGMDIENDQGSGSFAEDGETEIGRREIPWRRGGEPNRARWGSTQMTGDPEPEPVQARLSSLMGSYAESGAAEIGHAASLDPYGSIAHEDFLLDAGPGSVGPTEIGAEEAVLRVVQKARDNRQPPPPMRAVDVGAPPLRWEGMHSYVGVVLVGGGGKDLFPLTTALMLHASASGEPRIVRIDTPESYKRFRAEESPEMAEFTARVAELSDKLDQHISDPNAHEALAEEIDEVVELGAVAEEASAAKRVELWMPKRYEGLIEAWREGDFVCVSLALPGHDGEVRICTSLEPVRRCVAEIAQHAKEARVPASAVLGVLPAMGCVLGAGTVIKEVAKAAPEILKHPNATTQMPFVLRIEPKVSPALAAMAQLAVLCKQGNVQAVDEWQRLGAGAPGPLKQAMREALSLVKAA